MKTYILKEPLSDADPGTHLYFQDGVYFYKTRTEQERWIDVETVENNPNVFIKMTILETTKQLFPDVATSF